MLSNDRKKRSFLLLEVLVAFAILMLFFGLMSSNYSNLILNQYRYIDHGYAEVNIPLAWKEALLQIKKQDILNNHPINLVKDKLLISVFPQKEFISKNDHLIKQIAVEISIAKKIKINIPILVEIRSTPEAM